MKPQILITIVIALFFACEENGEMVGGEVPGNLISSSVELFNGQVTESGLATMDGFNVWKVTVENSEEAIVTFYWRTNFGNLHRIDGVRGPFNYELNPPQGVINFSTARFLVQNNNSINQIERWEFVRDDVEPLNWYYIFYSSDPDLEIVIDAANGEMIR